MFWINRSLCYARLFSQTSLRCLPRIASSAEHQSVQKTSDYAVINNAEPSAPVAFNDYNLIKPSPTKIQSRPVPTSVPKLVDVQTGLNEFVKTCDERMLLTTVQTKYKLFDSPLVATFIQRLEELDIKRDSTELQHQRLYDFVDYLILKHGAQLDFEHVRTMFFQLASLNGTSRLDGSPGSYAIKALIQLLKHNVNKYHLQDTGRLLITLEQDLACQLDVDERIRPLFDALFLLTKFRQSELDRLDAHALAELAYVFASKLDHVYFTNILTEYIHDEYYHDKYSTMLMFRALHRRAYRHNRTLDVCLHFVHENKEIFSAEEMKEIKEYLQKLEYNTLED